MTDPSGIRLFTSEITYRRIDTGAGLTPAQHKSLTGGIPTSGSSLCHISTIDVCQHPFYHNVYCHISARSLSASLDILYFIFPRLIQLPQKNIRIKVLNDSAFLSIFQSSTDSGKTVLFFFEPPESGTYHFAGVIITPSGNVGTDKLLKMRSQSNSYSSWNKQSIYTLICKNKSYIIQIRKIRVKTARNIRTSGHTISACRS